MFLPVHGGLEELSEHGQFAQASMLTLLRHTGNGAVVLSNLERAVIQLFPFGHVAGSSLYFRQFSDTFLETLSRHSGSMLGYRIFLHLFEDGCNLFFPVQLNNGPKYAIHKIRVFVGEKRPSFIGKRIKIGGTSGAASVKAGGYHARFFQQRKLLAYRHWSHVQKSSDLLRPGGPHPLQMV